MASSDQLPPAGGTGGAEISCPEPRSGRDDIRFEPQLGLPSYLAFWGKARPKDNSPRAWHPTAYHCLDVAATLGAMLDVRPMTLRRASTLLGLGPAEARTFLAAVAALHDIGKFADGFVAQRPDLWPPALGRFDPETPKSVHTKTGYALWKSRLRDRVAARIWSGDDYALTPIMRAAFSRHGRPLDEDTGVFDRLSARARSRPRRSSSIKS